MVIALSLLSYSLAEAATVSKHDLEYLQQQVAEQNFEHKKLQAQATKVNLELSQISRQMVKIAKQIQNSEDGASKMEKELLSLQEELKIAEENFIVEDKNLIGTLYALQNLALKPTESLFVQPLTPVEIIRSAMLLRETVPFLAEEAAAIRRQLEAIAKKKEQIEKQVAKISNNRTVLEKKHEQMKILAEKKAKYRSQIETKSVETKHKIKELADQARDIKELLIKLEKEKIIREKLEAERREKERREREMMEQARRERAIEEGRVPDEIEPDKSDDLIKYNPEFIKDVGKNFAKAKGRLSMPARGPLVVSYGQETAKGVSSKGITIQTRNKAQVISPFDGSVIFAGPFRGYGKIIIIEHGQGYMSLLAGLDEIGCEVGQMLLAGEPIGQMPAEGEAKLYVELRKDSRPIDPTAWMSK